MIHWQIKLFALVTVALGVASALGKGCPSGFHW